MTTYFADYAWLGGDQVTADVAITVDGGSIAAIESGVVRPARSTHLPGVTLPAFANAHSHAFHRVLRGRTQRGGGTFWTWREDMYRVAARLTPDSYFTLAKAVYAEMALAGISCVGEFHYVHHNPDGTPYANPNAMGDALIAAAGEVGIRITLLDTCYLAGGFGTPLQGPQVRFGDRNALRWAQRVSSLAGGPHAVIGAAIHSVRGVPAESLAVVADWARERSAPLHFHVSEQRAENEACLAAHGCTPVQLLADHGALGGMSSAVHATHLTAADHDLLVRSGTTVCMTPTTERDLADGVGPARQLAEAGVPLSLGSDSNAVIDLIEESRAMELHERLRTERRGHWTAGELLTAATADGHRSLGWPDAGRLQRGALADFTTISLDSVRMAGWLPETLLESVVFAATSPDVTSLVVGGQQIVASARHTSIDVARDLAAALHPLLRQGSG